MPQVLDSVSKRLSFIKRKNKRTSVSETTASDVANSAANGTSNGAASSNGTSAPANGASAANGANGKSSQTQYKGTPGNLRPVELTKPGLNGYTPTKTETEAQGRYPDPPDAGHSRPDIEAALGSFMDVVNHAMRPLPTQTGDGSYLEDDMHPSKLKDLQTIGIKDLKTLRELLKNGKAPVDDKTMLMERVIQLVADLPDGSSTRTQLTNQFVDQLFTSLPHPPLSYLSDKFKYRQADGSYNNIQYPHIGKANTPYARTVIPETIQTGSLPDPGLIFDSLFARSSFRPHPNNNSSIIFYWASIIIHDLFQTDHEDYSNSKTSSYLDLSPLYGDVQEDQDQIRTFKDGKLKPDCFAEERLLAFPPGCGVILIMFNRFHNYVAEQLAAVNENGRFNKPAAHLSPEAAKKAWEKYDYDLFNTARLVTSGLYMNITLIDYVRTIVNLNRSNTTWTLDPRVKMGNTLFNDDGTPRGIGNQVSCEFNLVYRWHSAISQKDEAWTEGLMQQMFGKPSSEISMPEMLMGLHKMEMEMPKDPFERNFNGLKRGPDGKFSDDELVEIITSSIEDVAGAFGANHVPKCLKAIEILGMKQARAWDCASLNEFRKFFGLQTHKTFLDINPDPKVAEQMKNLYEHPDYVELYPGLVAEAAKQPMTEEEGGPVGVGISPTYTISRAILSDAVALVRGDRFYTIDYHPKNLTNWGYSEVAYDFNVEQGCCFYKLFIRAFPDHFLPNSIYAHMPMTTPEENRKIMQNLGRESHYSWERPKRQGGKSVIKNYHAVKKVLENANNYQSIWGDATEYLMPRGGRQFMLSGDGQFYTGQKKIMREALYKDQWHKAVKDFYEGMTLKLLREKSVNIAGRKQIDISRDVGNLAHVHFAANVFSLPLKSDEHPRGIYSEHELWLVMAATFAFIFFDVDPVKTFPLALVARKVTQQLGKLVEANIKLVSATGWISGIADKFQQQNGPLADYGVHMVRRLLASGLNIEEITWSQVLPTAVAMTANQAQVFTQVLEFYMSPAGSKHWPEIQRLARENTDHADEILLRYVQEANRIVGTFGALRKATAADTLNDEGFRGTVEVKPGDKIFVSFIDASHDPTVFPDPSEVKLDRPMENYLHYGAGPHECLGRDASRIAITAMIKTIARLENVRPAPGPQGIIKKVPAPDGFYAFMTEDMGKLFPFPTTWKLHYDGEIPSQ